MGTWGIAYTCVLCQLLLECSAPQRYINAAHIGFSLFARVLCFYMVTVTDAQNTPPPRNVPPGLCHWVHCRFIFPVNTENVVRTFDYSGVTILMGDYFQIPCISAPTLAQIVD